MDPKVDLNLSLAESTGLHVKALLPNVPIVSDISDSGWIRKKHTKGNQALV